MSEDAAGLCATSTMRVRYAETDQMGVVYHTHYLVWCEVGRTDFIRELGMTYAQLEEDGLRLAVANASIRYRAPARYDDVIRVDTRIREVRSRDMTFGYEILRPDDAPADATRLAVATTRLVAMDTNGRPRRIPAELRDRFREAAVG